MGTLPEMQIFFCWIETANSHVCNTHSSIQFGEHGSMVPLTGLAFMEVRKKKNENVINHSAFWYLHLVNLFVNSWMTVSHNPLYTKIVCEKCVNMQ